MHDTAFQIGGLVIDRYGTKGGARILEVGSLDVNGSLRHHVGECSTYIGLDFDAGAGVDHVIRDREPWPVEDGSFDLVMASSVLEHDPMFWDTFLRMVRKARPGGYIYLNAPSNGWIHRYPTDCWRFYPDSARALAAWSGSQGLGVTLVESFTADRADDVWNDWCAVFRREPSADALPHDLIHETIRCRNVICWKSDEILKFDERTEDMAIIAGQRTSQQAAEARIAGLEAERDAAERLSKQLSSTLAQSQDEVAELRKKIAADRAVIGSLQDETDKLRSDLRKASAKAASAKALLSSQALHFTELERGAVEREVLAKECLRKALQERAQLGQRLARETQELAQMARLLKSASDARDGATKQRDWLLSVLQVIDTVPKSWSILPAHHRRAKLNARLKLRGLFDVAAYLERYPDVAGSEMDALTHYLRHGMLEGRAIGDQEASA
jgi:uncharacterized coiled-coil protein SlyX